MFSCEFCEISKSNFSQNTSGRLLLQIDIKVSGEVESNPGPAYAVEKKAVMRSFHQGDRRFGDTAGIQYACNSLYALCWSS